MLEFAQLVLGFRQVIAIEQVIWGEAAECHRTLVRLIVYCLAPCKAMRGGSTMAPMRKLAFVFGCALISAPAVIARAQVQFTWIGWHAIPRTAGSGWCYVQGPHQHPYRALADMPTTVQNGGYVYTGQVLPPPWNGWHAVPGGGWCYQSGVHNHPYKAPDGFAVSFTNGYYQYTGQVPNPPWFGYHQVPGGGWCYIAGRHEHPYRPTDGWPVTIRDNAWVYTGDIPPQRPTTVAQPPGYGRPITVAQPPPPAYPPPQPTTTAYPPPQPPPPPPPTTTPQPAPYFPTPPREPGAAAD